MSDCLDRLLIKTKNGEIYLGYHIDDHFEVPEVENDRFVKIINEDEVDVFYDVDFILAEAERCSW